MPTAYILTVFTELPSIQERKSKRIHPRYFRRRNTWIEWPHSEMKAIEKIPKLLVETLVESFHQKGKKKK